VTPATTTPPRPLTRKEAAEFLRVSENTLCNWAATPGKGPRFSRSSKRRGRVWYAVADLVAYLERQAVSN